MTTTTIFTIGHSTHPLATFTAILRENGITLVADVRTVPRSRHNPQFNVDTLPESLEEVGINYVHLKELGGLRHARSDSANLGWQNISFRGYADYMQTEEFDEGLRRLIDLAGKNTIVLMCAEAVPWRCHRSLIGDALLVHGVTVMHLLPGSHSRPHTLMRFAKVEADRITYPRE